MSKKNVPAPAAVRRIHLPLPSAPGYHVVQAVANAFGRTYLGIAFHPDGYATAGKAALYSCRLNANGVTDWREHWQSPLASRYVQEGERTRLIALEFGFTALLSGPDEKGLLAAFIDRATSRLLICRDGDSVDVEANPPAHATGRTPFRHLALTTGGVFASPASSPRNASVRLYRRTSDDSRGLSDWETLTPPTEGNGRHISCLMGSSGRLYAGIACPARGFELWCYDPSSPVQSQWQCLLDLGALRYSANAELTAIAPDGNGGLWLGTGGGENGPVGDEGAEILRWDATGEWQLVMGEARFSPKGLVLPTSCCGPGVDDHAFTRVRALHANGTSLSAILSRTAGTGAPLHATRVLVCSMAGGTINQISPGELDGMSEPSSAEVRGFVDLAAEPLAFGTQFDDPSASASIPALWRLGLAHG
jgi:hypothetical protein